MKFLYSKQMLKDTLSKISKFAAAALCAWLLNACSMAPPGAPSFTVISDQTDKMRRHYVSAGGGTPVESKNCITSVFFHIIWSGTPLVEETLLASVLEEHNADALMDAEFKYSFAFFPYVFSRSCITISGTPVKLKGKP